MSNYHESEDLKKFADIGQHAKKLADDFFKYYGNVTGTDGALSKREKALIALAVMQAGITLVHSVQMQNHLKKMVL